MVGFRFVRWRFGGAVNRLNGMQKTIGLAVGLGTTLLLCSCLATSKKVVYEDERVVVTERLSFYVIPPNVHAGSDTISMRLFGKTYKEIRGTPPYYLEIPGTESILFVTGRDYDERSEERRVGKECRS